MATSFTPGPWEAKDWRIFHDVGRDIGVICEVGTNKASRTAKNAANARLIAAAPDLLAACECQEARERYDTDGSGFTLPEADAVFKKHGFFAMLSHAELAKMRQDAIAKACGL